MTTVAQLIAKLQTLPQDAVVEVLEEYSHGYETSTRYGPIDIEHVYVIDFNDEKYTSDPRYAHVAGKKFIQLEAIPE